MFRETTSRTVPSRDASSWCVTGRSNVSAPVPLEVSKSRRASLWVTLPNVIASTRPTRWRNRRPTTARTFSATSGYCRQTCWKSFLLMNKETTLPQPERMPDTARHRTAAVPPPRRVRSRWQASPRVRPARSGRSSRFPRLSGRRRRTALLPRRGSRPARTVSPPPAARVPEPRPR